MVSLVDGSGATGTIGVGAYGGGIEEPYQRTGCGIGSGWNNEFETVRIRVSDFRRDGSGVDLTDVRRIVFGFGPSHGTVAGRLGLDEILFAVD